MEIKELIKKYGLEKPFKIKDENKKYAVLVKNPETDRINVIKFGQRGAEDYLIHKNKFRKQNFRARHKCAEKTNKLTPGFWSCEYSWGK